jgi:GH25 family lysozyme M1 (1,4-beta-N-acetylmuramidase)
MANEYIVTASPTLRVRTGPGTTFDIIGSLNYNERVEEIGANADRTWLQIVRLPDRGLTGWSSADYLQSTTGTPPPPPPPGNFVIGPDVSFYQDDPETPQGIDFIKMKASAAYVVIRAGQNVWVDSDFKGNWVAAKQAKLPRGSYWFFDSRAEPKKQAELWIQQFTGGDYGELPLFADFEESYGGPYKGWKNWVIFLDRLKQLVPGKEIAIYTAYYYWRDNAPNSSTQAASLNYFKQYPLWIAHYGATNPLVPLPWKTGEWLFWQYTETGDGALYGVESLGIDLNYFNGDLAKLKARFNLPDVPTDPDPDPDPDPNDPGVPTGKFYKVIAQPSLKVRKGPGLTEESIGLLYPNEQVEEIGANSDRSWLRIQRLPDKTLKGWSFGAYLQPLDGSPDPDPDPTDPTNQAEFDDDKPWYKVTLNGLAIRETPSSSGKLLGTLTVDDNIPALDDKTNASWIKIRRLNGMIGWVEKKNVTFVLASRPASIRQNFFKGITYLRKDLTSPRNLVVHVLAIDTQTVGLEFLVTPSSRTDGIMCTRTTAKFLEEFKVGVAINADGWSYLNQTTYPPATYCATGGEPVKLNGFAASRGKVVSPRNNERPVVYISQKNLTTVEQVSGNVFNALSADRVIVRQGAVVKNLAALAPNPRTAMGVNKNGRWLILMAVDGREFGVSEGVTLNELAGLLLSYGVYSGVNLDGGGSTTMVVKGVDGKAVTLNTAIDSNVPGRQRAVANHLGAFVK